MDRGHSFMLNGKKIMPKEVYGYNAHAAGYV